MMVKQLHIKWNNSEIEFLKENYSLSGGTFCAKRLGRKKISIKNKARDLHLSVDNERKKIIRSKNAKILNAEKYDISEFCKVVRPEIAYFLGYFWADGHIRQRQEIGSTETIIVLLREDAEYLFSLVYSLSKNLWLKRVNVGKYMTIVSYSHVLYQFLESKDFHLKSKVGFYRILQHIPNHLHRYFYLGLFDGDGCFLNIKRNNAGRIAITAPYNYDWSCMGSFLKENLIDYKIYNIIKKDGTKKSDLMILRKESLLKTYQLFYGDGSNIGLARKKNKFDFFISINYGRCI